MFIFCSSLFYNVSFAQSKPLIPDLSKINNEEIWRVNNREVKLLYIDGKPVIYLDSKPGDGVVWLKSLDFQNGIIEIDIKGKDVQGSSFVGIASRGVNDSTFDAVYFRPFNFLNKDPVRKSHSVQYVSYPVYSWEKLRNDFPGKYENVINPVPDPNSFFHAKIVIQKPKLKVYVNGSAEPSLSVEELSARQGGSIGLWVGNYSDGFFSNLKITKKD